MKAGEIKVGHTYKARVSGNLVDVRVDSVQVKEGFTRRYSHKASALRTEYHVTNLNTNRKLIFKSAAKFRYEVKSTKPE